MTAKIRVAPLPEGARTFAEVSCLDQRQLPLGLDRLHRLELGQRRRDQGALGPAERLRGFGAFGDA